MDTRRRRGRPPRAGERACCRVELTLTPAEKATLRRFAELNQCSMADMLRIALLTIADDIGATDPPGFPLSDSAGVWKGTRV